MVDCARRRRRYAAQRVRAIACAYRIGGGGGDVAFLSLRCPEAQFVHDQRDYAGCTTATAPSGSSGREWCYVEAQTSGVGENHWNYCLPAVDVASLVEQSARAAEEKTYELNGALEVVLGLSKEMVALHKKIDASCGSALATTGVLASEV